MGTSTDGILLYGFLWEDPEYDGKDYPWADWGEENSKYDEPEEWLAEILGVPPLSNTPTEKERETYYLQCLTVLAETKLGMVRHCSSDYPMYAIVIRESVQIAWRGFGTPITSLEIKPEWNENLLRVGKNANKPLEIYSEATDKKNIMYKIGWWLVSNWDH